MYKFFNALGPYVVLIVIVVLIIYIIAKKRGTKPKRIGQALAGSGAALAVCIVGAAVTDPANNCEHQWEIIETVEATVDDEGYIKKYCSLCDSEETEELPKLDDNVANDETTAELIFIATASPETEDDITTAPPQNETPVTDLSATEPTQTEPPVIYIPETAPPIIETQVPKTELNTYTYVLNTNTYKFHYSSCRSVDKIASHNYSTHTGTREDVIAMGYSACGICHP